MSVGELTEGQIRYTAHCVDTDNLSRSLGLMIETRKAAVKNGERDWSVSVNTAIGVVVEILMQRVPELDGEVDRRLSEPGPLRFETVAEHVFDFLNPTP